MKRFIKKIIVHTPLIKDYLSFAQSGLLYCTIYQYLIHKIGGGTHYYPIPEGCIVAHPRKIYIGYNSSVFRPGCYIQGEGTIRIGNNVQVAQNVGIVSTNHDLYDLRKKHPAPIIIGDNCWIGMNSVILAGVTLGNRTIVGAGSIVTKSFPEGNVVIAGNPAKIIKRLDENYENNHNDNTPKYYGFLSEEEFAHKKNRYIDI